MKCLYCGKEEAKVSQTTQSFKKDGKILLIDNVPLVSCQACGESYFTQDAILKMDQIRLGEVTETRNVSYASL